MSLDPITAGLDLAKTVVDKIWPNKSEQERAELAASLALVQGQLDINKAEATSANWFTSGWRPGIGWVCVVALACQYVARPLLQWAGIMSGHEFPLLPGIDGNLYELMLGLLGLGGLRTLEKLRGAEGRR